MGRKSNSAQLNIDQWGLIHQGERNNVSVEVSITFLVSASVGYTSKVNGKFGIQMVAAYLRQVSKYSRAQELFYKLFSKITNKLLKQLLSMTVCSCSLPKKYYLFLM